MPSWTALPALLALLALASPGSAETSADTVAAWADAMSAAIDATVKDVMQVPAMQEIINRQPFSEEEVDGTVAAAAAAAQVARVLDAKADLLAALADEALALYEDRASAPAVSTSEWSADQPLAAADAGRQDWGGAAPYYANVTTTSSTFVVPPVLAAADAAESVSYTAGLDAAFAANAGMLTADSADADAEVAFQYVGTADGVLRAFPGAEWAVDEFGEYVQADARLTPWFARAVAGPRNLVVLVDASGSSSTSQSWLRTAAASLLGTVSIDDSVMVAAVSGGSVAPLGCFDGSTLVRGTADNVAAFSAALDALDFGGGAADAKAAVEWGAALPLSDEGDVSADLASCETMVVLLSASAPADAADLDPPSVDASVVRVMTFNVNGGGDETWLRAAACAGAGVYQRVSSWADAWRVGLVYEVAADPSVGVTYSYGGGLRPDLQALGDADAAASLLTVAQALWTSGGELVGVVALDFVMYGLKDTLDSLKFQQSFPLLVNGAGDTLYHPLQTKYKQLNLFDVGRDISNYEYFDGWADTVRPGLVSGTIGQATLTVGRAIEKGDASFEGLDVEQIETTYFWQPVPGVPWLFLAFAYAANDLTQRVLEPSRALGSSGEDEPQLLFRTLSEYLEPELAALVPAEWTADEMPLLAGVLPAGQVVYNVDNCDDFTTCAPDAYCAATPNATCPGTCVCEPHRWPVGTISAWPASHYAPQCYLDPTAAFEMDVTTAVALDTHTFINRLENSSNPSPLISEACLLSMEINAKFFPAVKNASAHGLHDDTVWTYFGHSTGAIGIFPGSSWGNAYDPTRRPWYSRAIAYKGAYQHVVSTPYIDAGGAGLMNTFAEVAWEQQNCSQLADTGTCGDIIDDRVFGVHGWDMLYPDMDAYASTSTAHIAGGCGNATALESAADDPRPICFLFDPAGLLLTHSDFLLSAQEAVDAGLNQIEYDGEPGDWAVENVFLGKKEGPLAAALLDAGFLVERRDVLSETGKELLNYYETNPDALGDDGVLAGTLDAAASDGCYVEGAHWSVAWVAKSNIYLLVVDGYERVADFADSCATVELEGAVAVDFDTCAFSDAGAERAAALWECPALERPDTLALESVRASYASCEEELYIRVDEAPGGVVLAVTLVAMGGVAALAAALVYFRRAYVILASSPVFCLIICFGAALGLGFLLLMIGRPSTAVCHSRIWLAGLAFVFLFGPLCGKTWRIHRIFNNQSLKRVKITNQDLFKMLGAVTSVEVVILILWSAVVNPGPIYDYGVDGDPLAVYVGCGGDGFGAFVVVNCCYGLGAVCVAAWLSYQTRHTESEFNESSQIASAIYTIFFMGAIITPLTYALDVDYKAQFVLIAVAVLLTISVTLLVLFVPKLRAVRKTKKDFDSDRSTSTDGRTTEHSRHHN